MTMRLFVGGMRGSHPCTGRAFEVFGGETTSLLLLGPDGERVVLDAGTGLHAVAEQLADHEPSHVTVLLSHYHLDHMAGLTMNPLFYQAGWSFTFVGPTFAHGSARESVTRLLNPPYWPVSYRRMEAHLKFTDIAAGPIRAGTLKVRACPVSHPGGCVAYRIDTDDNSSALVFATDLEWQHQSEENKTAFKILGQVSKPADLLIIDAHFCRKNLTDFSGWGHSCWEDSLEVAASMGIQRVLLGHHAPEADDEILTAREHLIKKVMPASAFARGGQWLAV